MYSKSHISEEAWGTEYDGMMHVTDWLPTIAGAAGIELHGRQAFFFFFFNFMCSTSTGFLRRLLVRFTVSPTEIDAPKTLKVVKVLSADDGPG